MVTGAAQGIGARTAQRFAERGGRVAAVDVQASELTDRVGKLAAEGYDVHGFELDVTDRAAVERTVAAVEDTVGPIGTLVNAAGVLRTGAVTALSDDDWDAMFAVNVDGVFALSRAVARRMVPRGSGAIVTVSSNAGGVPRAGMAGYAASKAAVTMFTKSLGLELAPHGVRCNVVAPGSTDTPMLRGMAGFSREGLVAGSQETFKVGIPLGKLAEPDDIADAVLFLASDAAGHITMQELFVDGGAALGG